MRWRELLCPDRIRDYKGRPGSRDLRTEFEKDYHRIIGSASFRRLQDKTQVFPLDKSDFIRTRLTHSLEVSSLAKSLGQNVSEEILQNRKDEDFQPSFKADVCDILQCATFFSVRGFCTISAIRPSGILERRRFGTGSGFICRFCSGKGDP